VALLIALASCSGDEEPTAAATAERSATSVDEIVETTEGSVESALDDASEELLPGPTPIGPNTRFLLEGPPFAGLSSVANGCVLERQAADTELQNLYVAVVSQDRVPLDDVIALRSPAVDCAPEEMGAWFGEEIAERAGVLQASDTAACLGTALSTDADRGLLRALSAIDLDQVVPEPTRPAATAAIDSCFAGTGITPMVTAELQNAPLLAAAADSSCIDEALATPGSATGMWSAFVASSGVEPEDVPPGALTDRYSSIERCFSAGSVLASITAGYGFPLSVDTVTCLDERSDDRTVVQRVITGDEPDPAEFMPALAECASEEELDAITNG